MYRAPALGEIKLRTFQICLILVIEEHSGEHVNYSALETQIGSSMYIR